MKRFFYLSIFLLLIIGCEEKQPPVIFKKYDETEAITKQQEHDFGRMRFKLIQSKYLDMNKVFEPFQDELVLPDVLADPLKASSCAFWNFMLSV